MKFENDEISTSVSLSKYVNENGNNTLLLLIAFNSHNENNILVTTRIDALISLNWTWPN